VTKGGARPSGQLPRGGGRPELVVGHPEDLYPTGHRRVGGGDRQDRIGRVGRAPKSEQTGVGIHGLHDRPVRRNGEPQGEGQRGVGQNQQDRAAVSDAAGGESATQILDVGRQSLPAHGAECVGAPRIPEEHDGVRGGSGARPVGEQAVQGATSGDVVHGHSRSGVRWVVRPRSCRSVTRVIKPHPMV